MAYSFSIHTMKDGKFGPTPNGHFYQPMPYHNPNAQKRYDKSRWILNQGEQYEVFEVADTPTPIRKNWMNDDETGLYGMLADCSVVLGKDEEERLAFFPKPQNDSDPWHGYPTDSSDLGENLIEYWHDNQLISDITYVRLSRHEL